MAKFIGRRGSNNDVAEVNETKEDYAFGDLEYDEKSGREFVADHQKQDPPMPLGATEEELEQFEGFEDEPEDDTGTPEDTQHQDESDESDLDGDDTEDDEYDNEVEGLEEDGDQDETDDTEIDEEIEDTSEIFSDREYKGLLKQSKEEIVARLEKEISIQRDFQTKSDQLMAAIGNDFANEIFAGKVGTVAKRLLTDLKDESFQSHIMEFYDHYKPGTNGYVKVKDMPPSIGVLEKYQKLISDSQSISPQKFMSEGTQFDGSEAFVYGTESYIAREKYENEKTRINSEIKDILDNSQRQTEDEQRIVTESAKRAETEFNELKTRYKSLQSPKTEQDFKSFLAEARDKPIESFWQAYLYIKTRKAKKTNLDQNERRAIKRGSKKNKVVASKVRTRPVKQTRIEDDTFGDL